MEKRYLGAMGDQRSWLYAVAVLAAILVGWRLTAWGVSGRLALSLFPGGTIVPLLQIPPWWIARPEAFVTVIWRFVGSVALVMCAS